MPLIKETIKNEKQPIKEETKNQIILPKEDSKSNELKANLQPEII